MLIFINSNSRGAWGDIKESMPMAESDSEAENTAQVDLLQGFNWLRRKARCSFSSPLLARFTGILKSSPLLGNGSCCWVVSFRRQAECNFFFVCLINRRIHFPVTKAWTMRTWAWRLLDLNRAEDAKVWEEEGEQENKWMWRGSWQQTLTETLKGS